MKHIPICIQEVEHRRIIKFLVTSLSHFPPIAHIGVIEALRLFQLSSISQ